MKITHKAIFSPEYSIIDVYDIVQDLSVVKQTIKQHMETLGITVFDERVVNDLIKDPVKYN